MPPFSSASELGPQVASCGLPAVHLTEQQLCITGLCSTLRFLISCRPQLSQEPNQEILGYQGGCLSAPAEVSTWTKFCEVDLPQAVNNFVSDFCCDNSQPQENYDNGNIKTKLRRPVLFPEEFARFEYHMGQPVRMHNIRKRMLKDAKNANEAKIEAIMTSVLPDGRQVSIDEQGRSCDPIYLYAQKQHIFAEGPDFLLSDAVLFPQFYLVMKLIQTSKDVEAKFRKFMPKSYAWFNRVNNEVENATQSCDSVLASESLNTPTVLQKDFSSLVEETAASSALTEAGGDLMKNIDLEWPQNVPNQSLYKSDPKRRNPNARIFTRQPDIERAMTQVFEVSKLEIFEATPALLQKQEDGDFCIDWTSLPEQVHPLGGELPKERLEKKCQQLENLASAVDAIYHTGDVISTVLGGGHLAILLAYLLPEATVYLVENKEESLKRAIKRVQRLGLKNCRFFQGNMDYFNGAFDIGVSLHACGVATDLVIQKCIQNSASFVSCPCCYGSVQENHMVSYPRSQEFREAPINFKDYLVLGHTADQTHGTNQKETQGRQAMNIIDTDRAKMAMETGIYSRVELRRLQPMTCSPKNNLIIGVAAVK